MGSHADEWTRQPMTAARDRADVALQGLARRYLQAWGLTADPVLDAASERIFRAVSCAMRGCPPEAQRHATVDLTRRWMERFLGGAIDASPQGLFRAHGVLRHLPQALLDVPLPRLSDGPEPGVHALAIRLLPEPAPRPMREQEIEGATDRAVATLRDGQSYLGVLFRDELPSEPLGEP